MPKQLPLFAKFVTCLLTILLLEVPVLFAQTIPPNIQEIMMGNQKPKGKMVYEVNADSEAQKWLKKHPGVAPEDFNTGLRNGVLWAVKHVSECTKPDGGKSAIGDSWALTLDEDSKKSLFITNQMEKTASIKLTGTMRHWRRNGCTGEMRELASGIGGMRADFKTTMHMTSRNFQALAGKDDVAKSKYLNDVKEARLSFLKNLPNYYKHIKEYQMKPKFKFVKIPDVDVGGEVPRAPAGAVSDDSTAVIIGEGLGNAVKALDIWNSVKSPEDAAATLGGKLRDYTVQNLAAPVISMAVAEATTAHEANIIKTELPGFLSDPLGYAYDKGVADMVASVAAVNKMYADNGDQQSRQIQNDATKRTKFQGEEYQYVDADYLAALTLDAYNAEIKRLERERELEEQLPPSAARGMIWGPGIYEPIRAWSQNIGGVVAGSTATSEQQINLKDPRILAALKKAGRDISDLQKITKNTKPLFSTILFGREMIKDAAPKLQVMIYLGSPDDPYKPIILSPTIFERPFVYGDENDDGEKIKCRYVVATNGNDANKGTDEEPFATLQKALDRVEVCRGGNQSGAIFIKNGIYRQSAEKTWVGSPTVSALEIRGESQNGVIFTSAEVSNASWQTSASGFTANMPLHPQQPSWTPTSNIATNPPPVVGVNGQRLIYVPLAKNLPIAGTYNISGNKISVRPQDDVTDLNSATVEVGVRPFALKLVRGKNITVSNMTFRFFQTIGTNDTPGIIKTGSQVTVNGVNFQ